MRTHTALHIKYKRFSIVVNGTACGSSQIVVDANNLADTLQTEAEPRDRAERKKPRADRKTAETLRTLKQKPIIESKDQRKSLKK